MDSNKFDAIVPSLAKHLESRRRLVLLGVLGVAGLWRIEATEAKKKKHGRRHRCALVAYPFCVDGETVYVNSCGKAKLLKRGEQPGRCPGDCIPQCSDCTGGYDGCGGTCSCPEGQICTDATCQDVPVV